MQATHEGRATSHARSSLKKNIFFQCLPDDVEREQCDGNGGTSWGCMLRWQIIGNFLVSVMGLSPATSDLHAAHVLLADKVDKRAHHEEIEQHSDDIPQDHGS